MSFGGGGPKEFRIEDHATGWGPTGLVSKPGSTGKGGWQMRGGGKGGGRGPSVFCQKGTSEKESLGGVAGPSTSETAQIGGKQH